VAIIIKRFFDLRAPSLKRAISLMLPRTIGIAANQLNLIAPTIIAFFFSGGFYRNF